MPVSRFFQQGGTGGAYSECCRSLCSFSTGKPAARAGKNTIVLCKIHTIKMVVVMMVLSRDVKKGDVPSWEYVDFLF